MPPRLDPTAVSARAHQIWISRGKKDGRALDDWLQAERELLAEASRAAPAAAKAGAPPAAGKPPSGKPAASGAPAVPDSKAGKPPKKR